MMEIISRSTWRRSRWRNGAGWGWEIVAEPRSATDPGKPFEWRLAVSEIERDAPFSDYPGVERIITLLEGAGFDLDIAGHSGVTARERFVPHRFPGDRPTACRLAAGPCKVLNLMVARERWSAEVMVGATRTPAADVGLGLLLEGGATLDDEGRTQALGLHDLVVWSGNAPGLAIQPGTIVYCARLSRLSP